MTTTDETAYRRLVTTVAAAIVAADAPPCNVAGCNRAADNVIKQFDAEGNPVLVKRCRTHTSKWDRLVIGPGPA